MDASIAGLYIFTAAALLGSPGPAIIGLVLIGKSGGFRPALRTYIGLEAALAVIAALTLAGLYAVLTTVPAVRTILLILTVAYLLYLAYTIMTAPPRGEGVPQVRAGLVAGALLAIANPKVYFAFTALFAAYTLVPGDPVLDGVAKWALLMMVLLAVDMAWVVIGVRLGKLDLPPRAERALNVGLGLALIGSMALAFLAM